MMTADGELETAVAAKLLFSPYAPARGAAMTAAVRLLGLSRDTLRYRLEKYGIP